MIQSGSLRGQSQMCRGLAGDKINAVCCRIACYLGDDMPGIALLCSLHRHSDSARKGRRRRDGRTDADASRRRRQKEESPTPLPPARLDKEWRSIVPHSASIQPWTRFRGGIRASGKTALKKQKNIPKRFFPSCVD